MNVIEYDIPGKKLSNIHACGNLQQPPVTKLNHFQLWSVLSTLKSPICDSLQSRIQFSAWFESFKVQYNTIQDSRITSHWHIFTVKLYVQAYHPGILRLDTVHVSQTAASCLSGSSWPELPAMSTSYPQLHQNDVIPHQASCILENKYEWGAKRRKT